MRGRLLVITLIVSLGVAFTWVVMAQMPTPGNDSPSLNPAPDPTATIPAAESNLRDHHPYPRRTFLLWPQKLPTFAKEYDPWELWLDQRPPTPYSVRDALLVSIQAIAINIPDLEVETDSPHSDLIIVSGNPAALETLLYRLEAHPLLAAVSEDSPSQRRQAREAWTVTELSVGTNDAATQPSGDLAVNIRNGWVTNVVWGYTMPDSDVRVTLSRPGGQSITATVTADDRGRFDAYLPWEIRDHDLVRISDGRQTKAISVIPLNASSQADTARVTGAVEHPVSEVGAVSLDVVVGKTKRSVTADDRGTFTADLQSSPFPAGTPAFLRYTDENGDRIFAPFSTPIVNIRRDTTYGISFAHGFGLGSLVWGQAGAHTALTLTLQRAGDVIATRTVSTNQSGSFVASMDHPIQDGDTVELSDGTTVLKRMHVPVMTFHADPAGQIITGTAPANISTTEPDAPHSLRLIFASHWRQAMTDNNGRYRVDFTGDPFYPGALGTMRYITPEGDRIYEPLFVAQAYARGKVGDWWADIILGQPNFSQISFNEVVGNRLFNPGGVYVDRSMEPNRVYVNDGGNNRVLGFSALGKCTAGSNSGQDCTTDSDCPGSTCQIEAERPADIVLGQPSFNSSACNGDSSYQTYPEAPLASAESLCGQVEVIVSPSENGSMYTMATDPQGNLYVPDLYNNRILRYDDPFNTDTVADYVWGQANFLGTTCNHGIAYANYSDARSLCLAPEPSYGDLKTGVAIDSEGNLWVADTNNNRVLRFPFDTNTGVPATEADLVLGQPDFSTVGTGTDMHQMNKPASVRVDAEGTVYVADSLNDRVLVFEGPFTNGMAADRQLGTGLNWPTGLELAPDGAIWVNDSENHYYHLFVNEELQATVYSFTERRAWGGLGIDRDNNLLTTGWDRQEILRYSAPTYAWDATVLRSRNLGIFNETGPHGFHSGRGLEVASGQLIYADNERLLFWNNPWRLTNYQHPDGVVGQPDFYTRPDQASHYGRMRADQEGHLWVVHGHTQRGSSILGYSLPLEAGITPDFILSSPLPLKGGGVFTWTWSIGLGGIDVQPDCNHCLWVSDSENHRAFRITNIVTAPVVDVVLGQPDSTGMKCNRGQDVPSQDTLCNPGGLTFDDEGNLFLADHNLEVSGNLRLLQFAADTIPEAPSVAVFDIPATRVFGRNDDFTEPDCVPWEEDPMCGPWEPAFDSRGRTVIGFNTYIGPRFPLVYENLLADPYPTAALGDFHSMPMSARFDQFDNLYILDHNRNRVLIYRHSEVKTYTITGSISTTTGIPLSDVEVDVVGYAASGTTDSAGVYTITGLVTDTYTLAPDSPPYLFGPATRYTDVPTKTTRQDFVAYTSSLPPLASFSVNPQAGPLSMTVQFTDASIGFIDSWLWNFGDGTTSTLPNPQHTYTETGSYTVTLTVSGSGGSDSQTRRDYITVAAPPVAALAASPLSGTVPLRVQFGAMSTGIIDSWLWDFGDGMTSTSSSPVHTYTVAGNFTVTLAVSGPGGSDTVTATDFITAVWPPPVAAFSALPTSGTIPLTVQFSDASTGTIEAWRWEFGDGGTSDQPNPRHIYGIKGTYTVTLTVTGPGGNSAETRTGYITVRNNQVYLPLVTVPKEGAR